MFLHGCNYPWSAANGVVFYGLDFGRNVWGTHVGVSTRRQGVLRDLDAVARLGFTTARWFVFADGRAGLVADETGAPLGLDDRVCPDLDAALEAASLVGVKLHLVLFDHRWMFAGIRASVADPVEGCVMEHALPDGRAASFVTSSGQRDLFDRVVAPLVTRYGRGGARSDLGSAIRAWELMNEPDFVVEGWSVARRVRRAAPWVRFREAVAACSDIVHGCSDALTSMAAARQRHLRLWDDDGLGLDLLQLHCYPDRWRPSDPDLIGTAADAFGLSRPLLIGEVPANGPHCHPAGTWPPSTTLGQYLDHAVGAGYAGAWPWSFSGTDGYGPLPPEPLLRFADEHPQHVHPRTGGPPLVP